MAFFLPVLYSLVLCFREYSIRLYHGKASRGVLTYTIQAGVSVQVGSTIVMYFCSMLCNFYIFV